MDNDLTKIEILKRVYAAINQNNTSEALFFFDSDSVRIEPESFPSAGTYHGHSEIQKHFFQSRQTWAEGTCAPEGFITNGDKVVVLLHVQVRLKDQTDWIDGRFADVFTFNSSSKIIEMRTFSETHEALLWTNIAVL